MSNEKPPTNGTGDLRDEGDDATPETGIILPSAEFAADQLARFRACFGWALRISERAERRLREGGFDAAALGALEELAEDLDCKVAPAVVGAASAIRRLVPGNDVSAAIGGLAKDFGALFSSWTGLTQDERRRLAPAYARKYRHLADQVRDLTEQLDDEARAGPGTSEDPTVRERPPK